MKRDKLTVKVKTVVEHGWLGAMEVFRGPVVLFISINLLTKCRAVLGGVLLVPFPYSSE
jgi:hypothetical protein